MADRPSARLGLWASLVLAALGGVYLVLLLGYFATEGFAFPPPTFVQTVGGLVTILSAPAILVIFVAIRELSPPDKSVYATLGLSFTILFVTMVSINRFVQLTVIRFSGSSSDLGRFLPYSTNSVMFALEILGWGFFLSLASLSIAPLFSGSSLHTSIRWLLVLFAIFSFMSVIGFTTATPVTAIAFIAWGPILLALAILLAIMFRKDAFPHA